MHLPVAPASFSWIIRAANVAAEAKSGTDKMEGGGTLKKNPIILSGHEKWNGIPMLRVELWYGRGTCNADEASRTAIVCGRLLHNVLHALG